LFFSSITNKLLYGVFGAVDFVTHSCRALLRDHVTIVADGETVQIPRGAEGIIVLNLNSYAGGARMWDAGEKGTHRKHFLSALLSGGVQDTRWCDPEDDDSNDSRLEESSKEKRKKRPFGKSKRDDGLLDVVAVYGAFHLGQLSLGTDRPVRLKQARDVRIDVSSDFPVHVDGQPWEETGGATIAITRRDCVSVLAADPKSSMTSVGSGRGYERDELGSEREKSETRGVFMGWEAWENPEYYDDLESAPHTCVRSMLD
jgi:diacylglycerol kinase (ATP)